MPSGRPAPLSACERGYAMVALLVSLNIMAIMMAVALPTWRQMVQREKEAELVFRGQQYVRAIQLYQRRNGPGTLPPSLDVLVEEKFLRRAYKDPITGEAFTLLRGSGAAAGGRGQQGVQGRGGQQGRGAQQGGRAGQQGGSTTGPTGGIIGVVSKSEAPSIRLYNGRGAYNEWEFVFTAQAQGGGGGGIGPRGGQGGGGQGPRGGPNRGNPPPGFDGPPRGGTRGDSRGPGGGRGGGGQGRGQGGGFSGRRGGF